MLLPYLHALVYDTTRLGERTVSCLFVDHPDNSISDDVIVHEDVRLGLMEHTTHERRQPGNFMYLCHTRILLCTQEISFL